MGPAGIAGWIGAAYRFATDRNDFRRNVLINLGLFTAGVWVAKNLSDFDLTAPQPI
ncbi:TOM6 protein, partial [Polyodon spathula]|nr:TOM6 protein [Polyodon spathula]